MHRKRWLDQGSGPCFAIQSLSFPLLTQGSDGWDHAPLWAPFPSPEAANNTLPVSSQMLSRGPFRLEMLGQHYSPCRWDKAHQPHWCTSRTGPGTHRAPGGAGTEHSPDASFHASLSAGIGHAGVSFPETEDAATGRDLLVFYLCCNKTINLVTLKQYKCIIVQEARSWTWLSLG